MKDRSYVMISALIEGPEQSQKEGRKGRMRSALTRGEEDDLRSLFARMVPFVCESERKECVLLPPHVYARVESCVCRV